MAGMESQITIDAFSKCSKLTLYIFRSCMLWFMIGGGSMGNWFENMEPTNIQEERAKTKKAEESSLAKSIYK